MQGYKNVICDKCKRKPANFHTVIEINGNRYEANLCQQCYFEEKAGDVRDFVDFLSTDEVCPTCNTRLSEIESGAYVGCSDCYNVFRREVLTKIQAIHGTRKHQGKRLRIYDGNKQVNLSDRESMEEQYFLAREEGRLDDVEELFNDYLKGENDND